MKTRYIIFAFILALLTATNSYGQIRKAERLFNEFNYAKATPVYERIAGKNNKNTPLALTRLGDINRLSSHYAKAAEWYEKAIATAQANPEIYINYGQVLRSLGKYEEAIAQFEKFQSINPKDNRAKIYADYCRQVLSKSEAAELYEVYNAKGLNSSFADFSPVVRDGKVVFTSDRTMSTGNKKYGWTGADYLDMYQSNLPDINNPEKELTDKPEKLSTELNMPFHDGPASFTADNNTIWFTRVYKKMGELDSSRFYTNKLKIYTSTYDGKKWSDPEPFYLNSEDYSVGHPAISADGKTLYFASDMPGGNGGTDIFTVELTDGGWSNLKNLGTDINTFGNEMFPFIDGNGNLYFASDGWPGLGSLDVFKATQKDGKWNKPENLRDPVNSSADDFGFFKDKSGVVLFSSNRAEGSGSDDIYMAAEIKYADSVFVSGLVKDRNTGELLVSSTVLVWDQTTDDVFVLKTNEVGEYGIMLKTGHNYVFKAVKKGFSTDCLSLQLPEFSRENTKKNRDLLLMKLKVNEIFRLENVYYDFDKYNIRKDASVDLDKVIDFLNQNPQISVELGSHTDCRGSFRYNDRLSERRSNSAVKYIVKKGIDNKRITAKGYGEYQLVNKCADGVECTEQEHQDNRRTEIKIIGLTEEVQGEDVEPLEALKNGQRLKLTDLSKDLFINCSDEKGI
jgi:outer membrane protein OmpA-like peptidoglycan-associated protein